MELRRKVGMDKIGIIGYGFVGKAVGNSYNADDLLINDPVYPKSVQLAEMMDCRAIFVCVPTPTKEGSCDISIINSVLDRLNNAEYQGIVIVKSTVPPDFYIKRRGVYKLKLAYIPEFLTQRTANHDYLHPHKIVIGCDESLDTEIVQLLKDSKITFNGDYECVTIEEASFFKYLANTQLAMKVIINNEYKQLAEALGIDWQTVADLAITDYRLGMSHWQVPGPDGQLGFGGACFPKDTEALLSVAKSNKVNMSMLDNAIRRNKEIRFG